MRKSVRFSVLASFMAAIVLVGDAFSAVTPMGDTSFAKVAKPGERYQGTIALQNNGSAPVEVKLYQTDYHFTADGRIDYGKPGILPRSNARWISLGREVIVIAPNSKEQVGYEVHVPEQQGLNGSYWSMIMVEPIAASSAESTSPLPDQSIGIKTSLRYGMQIITEIGKSGAAGLAFSNPQLSTEDGKRTFTIDVENTGERWLVPSLWLELYTETGTPVGKFHAAANRLFPGTSVQFSIELGDVPRGKYLGLVAADGTGDNLFGANVELDIE